MGFWNWFLGGKEDAPSKVEFKDKDRVEPTLEMVDPGLTIGQMALRGYDLYRWTNSGWAFVCRMPKPSEVHTVDDLPEAAPFNHIYMVGEEAWCWDGACWVKNSQRYDTVFDGHTNRVKARPISVTPPSRQGTQGGHATTTHRIGDPHPTDSNNLMSSVLMMQMLVNNSSSEPSRSHSSSSSSRSHHDDTSSHHSSSNDHNHSSSSHGSDYGSDYSGGSSD